MRSSSINLRNTLSTVDSPHSVKASPPVTPSAAGMSASKGASSLSMYPQDYAGLLEYCISLEHENKQLREQLHKGSFTSSSASSVIGDVWPTGFEDEQHVGDEAGDELTELASRVVDISEQLNKLGMNALLMHGGGNSNASNFVNNNNSGKTRKSSSVIGGNRMKTSGGLWEASKEPNSAGKGGNSITGSSPGRSMAVPIMHKSTQTLHLDNGLSSSWNDYLSGGRDAMVDDHFSHNRSSASHSLSSSVNSSSTGKTAMSFFSQRATNKDSSAASGAQTLSSSVGDRSHVIVSSRGATGSSAGSIIPSASSLVQSAKTFGGSDVFEDKRRNVSRSLHDIQRPSSESREDSSMLISDTSAPGSHHHRAHSDGMMFSLFDPSSASMSFPSTPANTPTTEGLEHKSKVSDHHLTGSPLVQYHARSPAIAINTSLRASAPEFKAPFGSSSVAHTSNLSSSSEASSPPATSSSSSPPEARPNLYYGSNKTPIPQEIAELNIAPSAAVSAIASSLQASGSKMSCFLLCDVSREVSLDSMLKCVQEKFDLPANEVVEGKVDDPANIGLKIEFGEGGPGAGRVAFVFVPEKHAHKLHNVKRFRAVVDGIKMRMKVTHVPMSLVEQYR